MPNIKQPNVAGKFYPSDARELRALIRTYLDQAEEKHLSHLRGVIAPHAGYAYSGKTAGVAYKQIQSLADKPWKVLILAPSHYEYFEGVSVGNFSAYKTPLKETPIHTETVLKLLSFPGFSFVEKAFEQEHSLEVQIPFLQTVLKNFSIVPILFGNADYASIAEKLNEVIDARTLLVVSSDLSHFYDAKTAKKLDEACLNGILHQNMQTVESGEACGKGPILTLLFLAKKRGWRFELLDYSHSGEVFGDMDSVVGYGSIAITQNIGNSEK